MNQGSKSATDNFSPDFPDRNKMLSPSSWDGKNVESNVSKDWEVDSKCLLVTIREDNNELDMHKVGRKHIRLHHVPGHNLYLLAAVMTLMILLRILFPQTFS